MARAPKLPQTQPAPREEDLKPVMTPTGRFVRPHQIRITTYRFPQNLTTIDPDDVKTGVPEMPYGPPA